MAACERAQRYDEMYRQALKDRNDLMREASNRGVSLRVLGKLVGISAAGVHRAIGHVGSVDSDAALDLRLDGKP